MDLTDTQWEIVCSILPEDPVRADRRGRPWSDRRTVLNGILWILRTGAQWADLPERYGSYKTVHRRFQNWVKQGFFEDFLVALAEDLQERGQLDLEECFIDGTFVPAKKEGSKSARPSGAREPRSWLSSTAMMISPNRSNRIRRTQVGRPLRRYRRRWKIERLFAWLHNFRRLVTRWEFHFENFAAFLYLGCAVILLKNL